MAMKKILTALAFFLFGNFLFAQSESETNSTIFKKQVSLNFTNFFLRFTNENEPNNTQPEFLLYYKKGDDKSKWRHGFGADFRRENIRNREFQTVIRLDYSFGKEYYRSVARNWVVYFAWEGLIGGTYFEFKSKNSSGNTTNTDWFRFANLGIQGIGGLQFQIKERLSLLTETSYGLFFTYSKDDRERENYFTQTEFRHPISIILSYHF